MKTIYTKDGYIPEHRVIRFYTTEEQGRDGNTYTRHWVEYQGADGVTSSRCHEESRKDEPPLIPAAPGFSLLSHNLGLRGDETDAALATPVPVVAWRLRSDRVEPVPLGSLLDHSLWDYAVLTPGGTVYATEPYIPGPEDEGEDACPSYNPGDPWTHRFDSVKEWAAWYERRRAEIHKPRTQRTPWHDGYAF